MIRNLLTKSGEFVTGLLQGFISNILLFMSNEDWHDHFGNSQHSPMDGDDGTPFTRTKYMGRVMGAAAVPYMVMTIIVLFTIVVIRAL